MYKIINFDKTFVERFNEYKKIFGTTSNCRTADLGKVWSIFLRSRLPPGNWQAIWKIPRSTCHQFVIRYPSLAKVKVIRIDYKDLKAWVKIVDTFENIFPEEHYVRLIHLWPVIEQTKSLAIIKFIANYLDIVRFFYVNLLMPWDYDEDTQMDWITRHLESRLRLHYDMKNGAFPTKSLKHVESLINDGKFIQIQREDIEMQLIHPHKLSDEIKCKLVEELADLHVRMLKIKAEMDIWENSVLRTVLIKKTENRCSQNKKHIWLIFKEGTIKEHGDFLVHVRHLYPHHTLSFSASLSETLKIASKDDIFLIHEKNTVIDNAGEALEMGGVLKGFPQTNMIRIISITEKVLLKTKGNVILENVIIQSNFSFCPIQILDGKVMMTNCQLFGKKGLQQGIILESGAALELKDCVISDFHTGITCNSGSFLSISNSRISNVNVGLKLHDNCKLTVENCVISNCLNHGLCFDTPRGNMDLNGDFQTLEKNSEDHSSPKIKLNRDNLVDTPDEEDILNCTVIQRSGWQST